MTDPTPPARIEYVGHATVLVDLGGVRLLTDPLLRNRVAHLRRAVKVDAGALRGVDAVLISHLHYDHLDLPSLQRLGREMPVVVPHGAGALDPTQGCGEERRRDARGRADRDRRGDDPRHAREPRPGPAALRRPRRAARIRDRGRRALGLLRRRHRRLRRDGRPGTGRRRAPPDLGLGADDGPGAHGSGPRGARRRRCSARASRSRSTGARTTRSTSGCRDRPPSSTTPPALFEQAVRRARPGDRGTRAPAGRDDGL